MRRRPTPAEQDAEERQRQAVRRCVALYVATGRALSERFLRDGEAPRVVEIDDCAPRGDEF